MLYYNFAKLLFICHSLICHNYFSFMENQTPTFNSIGDRVKYLQEEILKLTPNKFAKESGLAYNTLKSLYESDKDPRRSTIRKILDSYDGFVNPEWLIEGSGRPTLSAIGEHPAFAKLTSDDYWKKAGRLIRKKIGQSGKTVEQVAKAAGESKFFLEKTLRGQNSPTPMLMGTLLLQTGTTLDELAEELGIEIPKKDKPAAKKTGRSLATPVAAEDTVSPEELMEEAQQEAQPIQQNNGQQGQSATAYAAGSGTAANEQNLAQELRMRVEMLANRVAYLEDKVARMAQ
jgi:transcriptional regulator with XRE-family HTH domain